MIRFAHFSDPHLAPLPAAGAGELFSKRLIGFANWHLRRRHVTSPEVLAALIDDIHTHAPDHICLTGDLVNIGLDAEYPAAARFLAGVAPPERLSLVPGNHDAYMQGALERALGCWAPFIAGDDGATAFPTVRRRGDCLIIGLSSAGATPWFNAAGTLGTAQITRCGAILHEAATDGLFRLVLLHHPPIAGLVPAAKALTDAGEFCRMLAREGAELVLHGHSHRATTGELPGPDGAIPVYGVASASALPPRSNGAKPAAGWTLFDVAPHPAGWQIRASRRTLQPPTAFVDAGATSHILPRPVPVRSPSDPDCDLSRIIRA